MAFNNRAPRPKAPITQQQKRRLRLYHEAKGDRAEFIARLGNQVNLATAQRYFRETAKLAKETQYAS